MAQNNKLEIWVQISSAVAVLIGILLVVIQLRQNAELFELQILKEDFNSYIENEVSLLPENIYEIRQKSLDEPENLTLYDYQVLDGLYWATGVTRWRSLYELAERGLLDQSEWKRSVQEDFDWYLANPFGRAWWARMSKKESTLPTELVEYVNVLLADLPDSYMEDALEDVKNRIESAK
jgi:hypothetical protein